jgi:hypothetical protein
MVFCECGEEITDTKVKYCPECGAEIDWRPPWVKKNEKEKEDAKLGLFNVNSISDVMGINHISHTVIGHLT